MPKRLLTVRCQKIEPKDTDDVFVDPHKNFEFDFRDGQAIFGQPPSHGPRRPDVYEKDVVKHKRQCTAPELRAPTRDNGSTGAVDKRLQLTKVEDNWIGVAFGSPTHPLSGWMEDTSPVSAIQPSRVEGQPPQQTPSKWKKIGGIFRAKSPPQIQLPKNPTGDEFDPEQYKLGIPVRRVPWRNPRSPLAVPVIERRSIDIIAPSDLEVLAALDESYDPELSTQKELPMLEIDIPSTEMERYSVMFGDINGDYSPALSVRRNRSAVDLSAVQVHDKHDLPPLPIPIPVRTTTNTSTKIPYSLFPSPPKTKIFDYLPSTKATDTLLHVRSASAPATLSPCRDHHKAIEPCKTEMKITIETPNQTNARRASITEGEMLQPTTYNAQAPGRIMSKPKLTVRVDSTKSVEIFEIKQTSQAADGMAKPSMKAGADQELDLDQAELDKPLPLRPRRGPSSDVSVSPEDNFIISDKEDTPWVSKESLKSPASSHTSVEDEIFFDIKSFRGSKDQDVSQFFISRPDSTAVQHARSMSRKVKTKKPERMSFCLDAETQPVLFCMPPDLQAAEHYCLGPEPKVVEQNVRLSMFDEAIAEVKRLASPSEAVSPLTEQECDTETASTEQRPAKPTINIPTRLQGHLIAVPSPIIERSEESTPVSALRKSPVGRLRHIASQASHSSSNSPQSFSSSIWDVPPPVPEKDVKFLPTSKYSIRRKPINSTNTTQYRSHVPSKSVVDLPARTDQPSSSRNERSASFSVRSATEQSNRIKPSQRQFDQNTIAVTVQPTAECSVARTVSLHRKTSHQVLVSRSSSSGRKDDHRQRQDEEEKLRWSEEKRAMSPVVVLDVPKGHKPGASVNLVVETV